MHKIVEIKINIPDNCELVKEGRNTYVIKEKQIPLPKSWEEFCENYPVIKSEFYINSFCDVNTTTTTTGEESDMNSRNCSSDRNLCSTKEEAEAFLALMQLRRLRNAWVGDWDSLESHYSVYISDGNVTVNRFYTMRNTLSFPTKTMANDFAECFKNLILKAKILL